MELLNDFCDDDDDAREADEGDAPPPLRRAGFVNPGNTCYINAALQLLLHPLLCSLPLHAERDAEATLGSRALHAALSAALGLRSGAEAMQALACSPPRGFGWQPGKANGAVNIQEDAHEFVLKLLGGSLLRRARDPAVCARHVVRHVRHCGSTSTKRFWG